MNSLEKIWFENMPATMFNDPFFSEQLFYNSLFSNSLRELNSPAIFTGAYPADFVDDGCRIIPVGGYSSLGKQENP